MSHLFSCLDCLGTLGELNILRQLAHTILTEMKTVKIKIIIVRLYPGLINKPDILRINKTNIIMSLTRVMVDRIWFSIHPSQYGQLRYSMFLVHIIVYEYKLSKSIVNNTLICTEIIDIITHHD